MSKHQAGPGQGGPRSPETPTDTLTESAQWSGTAPGVGADPDGAVADYLRQHPDFFERHPEILGPMRIRHDAGGAVSLIERQVATLRRQLDTERGRLAHLLSRARDYEALSARHHDLVLHLIPAPDLDALHEVLHEGLRRELGAEAVVLKLFPLDLADAGATARLDPQEAAFRDFLDRPHALCGPLDPSQGAVLFGETGAGLKSAVLVPIRAGRRSGVLAIGAADGERFGPDMRTDLLDRLGEIVSAKLRTLGAPPVPIPVPLPAVAPVATPGPVAAPAPKRPSRARSRAVPTAPEPVPVAAPKPAKPSKARAKRDPAGTARPQGAPAPAATAAGPAPGGAKRRGPRARAQAADTPTPQPDAQTAGD